MADRVGFEPTVPLPVHLISSQGRYDHFDTYPYIMLRTKAARSGLPVTADSIVTNSFTKIKSIMKENRGSFAGTSINRTPTASINRTPIPRIRSRENEISFPGNYFLVTNKQMC